VSRKRPALFRGRHFEDVIILLCVRWYLRYSLTYRDLEEIMAERNLSVDHVTIWRWVQRYAPVLNRRIRREMRKPNRSWRVDETYVKVAGKWATCTAPPTPLERRSSLCCRPSQTGSRPSSSCNRRCHAADRHRGSSTSTAHPAYASAIAEFKDSGKLGRRCRCRTAPYLNNIIEQDHRFIKKRIPASFGFRSVEVLVEPSRDMRRCTQFAKGRSDG